MLLLPNALSTASKVRSDETAPLTDKDAVTARWLSDQVADRRIYVVRLPKPGCVVERALKWRLHMSQRHIRLSRESGCLDGLRFRRPRRNVV